MRFGFLRSGDRERMSQVGCELRRERAGVVEEDGIDLTPVLTGKKHAENRVLGWRRRKWDCGRNGFNNVWADAYIKGEWKYIREFRETPGYARSVDSAGPPISSDLPDVPQFCS